MAKQQQPGPDGIAVVDKPAGISSNGVVGRVRRALGTRKVGHAGTLDPMATGVLVFGVGRGTKLLHYLVGADKRYDAVMRLGCATETDDAMGSELMWSTSTLPTADQVHAAIGLFTGEIMQRPSTVSAIKVGGKRAYALARAGEDVDLPKRAVTIHDYQVTDVVRSTVDGHEVLDVTASVHCSSGTYIRALARDLGDHFGVGGHLTALRRTSVGPFQVSQACPAGDDIPLLNLGDVARLVLEHTTVDAETCEHLVNGRVVERLSDSPQKVLAVCNEAGDLVAIAEQTNSQLRPSTVFQPAARA